MPVAFEQTEHEMYGSLLASRQSARRRLLAIQQIERHHRDTPLADLAALAVSGALLHLTPDRDDVPQ